MFENPVMWLISALLLVGAMLALAVLWAGVTAYDRIIDEEVIGDASLHGRDDLR